MSAAVRRVLCFSGSLRRVSSNTAALRAAQVLAPADLSLELYPGLGALPLFNPDDEAAELPESVQALRAVVGQSDALLIACPEYAHGIPGAFKNLLDWLVGSLEFPDKPVLLINASARASHHAQDALCEILRTMSAHLLAPEPMLVALPGAGCTPEHVLADPARRLELETVLSCLQAALAGAA